MKARNRYFSVLLTISSCLLGPLAWAQNDCSAELTEIDKRIASGNYSQQSIQVALILKQTLPQICALMDASMRASIMESIEDILPTLGSQESREERAQSLTAENTDLVLSTVLADPPTGQSVASFLVEREDGMFHLWVWDWDIHNGNLRILYSTQPDRTQFTLPNWKLHVYVDEISSAGELSHQHVTSKQASDHEALALRRGFDEVLFQRDAHITEEPITLERWSISEQKLLASTDISNATITIDEQQWQFGPFLMATSDGNMLFKASTTTPASNGQNPYAWLKISPQGQVLGGGAATEIEDSIGSTSWFHTTNGGGGLIINQSPVDGVDLLSGLKIPAADAAHGNGMTAHVTTEKRVMIIDTNGDLAFTSTALERTIMPLATANTNNDFLAVQQWIGSLESRFDANRTTAYLNAGPHRLEMVQATERGYAFLTKVARNRIDESTISGSFIIEFDQQGETNKIFLEPIATQLGIKLITFAATVNGNFFLHGINQRNGDSHIILIDRNGDPIARAQSTNGDNAIIEGIRADDSGVWLYGHEYRNTDKAKLWLERIEFPSLR